MIYEVMKEVRNFFDYSHHFGEFKIVNGEINLPFIEEGQYFRILESKFNDGVYKYPCNELIDEAFYGCIWVLAVPPSFLSLVTKIAKYEENTKPSAYVSESFGGYSYTKATDSNGNPMDWKGVFSSELKRWRKL